VTTNKAAPTPTRRQVLRGIARASGLILTLGTARAAEDPRNAPQQFHRYGIDQETVTIVTTTGHYDFLVAVISNPGTPDSGFMSRRAVSPDEGLLYTAQTVGPLAVSNRGVPFPTDLLFISADGRVTQVRASIMANDNRVFSSNMPVKAALQVIAGTVMRISARPGDYVLSPLFGRTL